jgi:5,10-methylenetetrahydromethanopterin reductase
VPIFISAEGPRTLELAGEVADGVIMHTGTSAEVVAASLDRLAVGAKRAGRDVDAIEPWLLLKSAICDTHEAAIDQTRLALAVSACRAFRHGVEGKHVPAGLGAPLTEFVRRCESRPAGSWDQENAELLDEFGLTEFLATRFGVIGTPTECVGQLQAVHAAGIGRVILPALGPQSLTFINRFGREVLPHLG